MARVTVVIYKPVLDEFRGWTGPIGRATIRLAREIRTQQIAIVGKKTGNLASKITVGSRNRWARGIEVNVGAGAGTRGGKVGYALWNDQGTYPHWIVPRKRRPGVLIFFWAKVGHWVWLPAVYHPGNKAYHWAERGLRVAMKRWTSGL